MTSAVTNGARGARRQADRDPAREKALACVSLIAQQLGLDELKVLVLVGHRLAMRQEGYGRLNLRTNSRDWRREALDEAADGLVSAVCSLMRAGHGEDRQEDAGSNASDGGPREAH